MVSRKVRFGGRNHFPPAVLSFHNMHPPSRDPGSGGIPLF
jgi:hypothetical protein